MRNTGLLIDQRFLDHATGPGHPESPARLQVLERLFSSADFAALPRIAAREACEEELLRVHSADHVAMVAASANRTYTQFDPDTPASRGSFAAALLAAGGAMDMAAAVASGELANGFAALRPPGHHAESYRPMGFCLFNNVALVARHLQDRCGVGRVLVLDWDVHHGNGTQHSFYDDPTVMYASLHQYPFYPGTGSWDEVGSGEAAGCTVNVPMAAGSDDADYYAAFRELILPVAECFAPDFVLVSAGFDAHAADPLASINLSTSAFAEMACAAIELADRCCAGKVAMLLEGGYDLTALSGSVEAVLRSLLAPQAFTRAEGELGSRARRSAEELKARWGIS